RSAREPPQELGAERQSMERLPLMSRRGARVVGDRRDHRQIKGYREQPVVKRRHRAPVAPLIIPGDAEALTATMPGAEVEDHRRHEERSVVRQQNVAGDEDGERYRQHIDRHPAPQPTPHDRIVGGAEVKLAQEQVGHAQLAIAEPEEHERHHDQKSAASRRDDPEVCAFGEKAGVGRERGPWRGSKHGPSCAGNEGGQYGSLTKMKVVPCTMGALAPTNETLTFSTWRSPARPDACRAPSMMCQRPWM